MKNKGTTESYSAFIGIVIAFLMLTAIGCAVYNMYKPRSPESFDNLVNKLKTLEKEGDIEGEYPLFLEENWFVIGFDKEKEAFEYNPTCPASAIMFDNDNCEIDPSSCINLWGCYGFRFSQPSGSDDHSKKILKPKKKCGDKGCLCLCKIDKVNEQEPFLISEQACLRSDAICASFDTLNFVGSEECCFGTFIPGIDIRKAKTARGLKALKYEKSGNDISLRDLAKTDFEKVIEKQKQKVVKLTEYLKTRRNVYFVPVNWNLESTKFKDTVDEHLKYTQEKIKEVEKILGQTLINNLLTDFNVLILENLQCNNIDVNQKIEDIEKGLKECLTKSDLKITEGSLKDAIIIGLTTDMRFCSVTDSERIIISNYDDPSNTAHEWGHLMLFCDEYEYSVWAEDDRDGLPCLNPYPLCCKDHPYWEQYPEEYQKYLEKEKLMPNCYPGYEELSDEAKKEFKTKEEYTAHINRFNNLCHGHVCTPKDPKNKYCRGMMGPEITCKDKEVIYAKSLEYSYYDYYKLDDFKAIYGLMGNMGWSTEGSTSETVSDKAEWVWPVRGDVRVTSCFGKRKDDWHAGIDIGPVKTGIMGDPILVVADGVVKEVVKDCPNTPDAGCGGGYGNFVVVTQKDGYTVIYSHLMSNINLQVGNNVVKGQKVGNMGNSGDSEAAHLHFGAYITKLNENAYKTEGAVNPVCLLDTTSVASKCTVSPGTTGGQTCPV